MSCLKAYKLGYLWKLPAPHPSSLQITFLMIAGSFYFVSEYVDRSCIVKAPVRKAAIFFLFPCLVGSCLGSVYFIIKEKHRNPVSSFFSYFFSIGDRIFFSYQKTHKCHFLNCKSYTGKCILLFSYEKHLVAAYTMIPSDDIM